jgi:hypothetical protein
MVYIFFLFYSYIIVVLGIHCNICKSTSIYHNWIHSLHHTVFYDNRTIFWKLCCKSHLLLYIMPGYIFIQEALPHAQTFKSLGELSIKGLYFSNQNEGSHNENWVNFHFWFFEWIKFINGFYIVQLKSQHCRLDSTFVNVRRICCFDASNLAFLWTTNAYTMYSHFEWTY